MDELSSDTKEKLYRDLGRAVVVMWSNMPHNIQHHLFEEAVRCQGEVARQQLAVFLHDKHSRTSATLKARAMPEPDSLGG
jgi:hypothetical protein